MGQDCPTEDPIENFWQKLYTQVFEMTVRQIQPILTEPECRTLEKRADFPPIFPGITVYDNHNFGVIFEYTKERGVL